MSFSSPGFLFAFMPAFFLIYFLIPAPGRNGLIFLSSLMFYAVDAAEVAFVLLGSVFVNYGLGFFLQRMAAQRRAAWLILVFGVACNMIPLLYYKYWDFLAAAGWDALGGLGFPAPPALAPILLPAGISFFTFQGISYLVDVYRREIRVMPTLLEFGMYHTLFPQLIAGPIVRYVEVQDSIRRRPSRLEDVHAGLLRFCLGLGKKIIIADSMGTVADAVFALPPGQLDPASAWLGAICYTLQILFDFSGYSDMAIGLGRMLGFRFPENFDQPYRARSVTEFWRRWHMTLSRWFRDYLYIPLGGNRAGAARTYLNLLLVFALCGLWHGAAYSFLAWGLWHGLLLVIERLPRNRLGFAPAGIAGWAATMLCVIVGWVIFRAPTLEAAMHHLLAMSGLGAQGGGIPLPVPDKLLVLAVGVVASLAPAGWWRAAVDRLGPRGREAALSAGALALFLYSSALIAANGFNPFIYFRF